MKRATTSISKIRHKKLAKPLIPLGMRLGKPGKTGIWCRTSVAGMQALIGSLGLVEAERFMAAVSRDKLNYTEWRRNGLPTMSLDALAQAANAVADELNVKH